MGLKEVLKTKVDVKPKAKEGKYVALRNVERELKNGFKIVNSDYKDLKLSSSATARVKEDGDLVLMEK